MSIERLSAGQAFHQEVQSAFLTGLVGATGFRERSWRLVQGGRKRVDLAVVSDETMLTLIMIKGTDWDRITQQRMKRNFVRHLRQLQELIDTAIDDMEAGLWDSVAAVLLYPTRPANSHDLASIQAAAAEQDVMLAWYEDVVHDGRSNDKVS